MHVCTQHNVCYTYTTQTRSDTHPMRVGNTIRQHDNTSKSVQYEIIFVLMSDVFVYSSLILQSKVIAITLFVCLSVYLFSVCPPYYAIHGTLHGTL